VKCLVGFADYRWKGFSTASAGGKDITAESALTIFIVRQEFLSIVRMLTMRWTMKPKLKILLSKGWRVTVVFGRNLVILRRGNGEIVYNVANKEIVEITPWVGDIDDEED